DRNLPGRTDLPHRHPHRQSRGAHHPGEGTPFGADHGGGDGAVRCAHSRKGWMKTMASLDGTREEALEVEIAEYLGTHGWLYSPNDDGYDAERAIWPEDVLWWLGETQPEEYAKVVRVGTGAEQ